MKNTAPLFVYPIKPKELTGILKSDTLSHCLAVFKNQVLSRLQGFGIIGYAFLHINIPRRCSSDGRAAAL